MTQTYVIRTTGFNRSEFDEGFELFAVDLDKDETARLLELIKRAKQLAKADPDFQYLTLKDESGHWLSAESVQDDVFDKMEEACEADKDLVLPIRSDIEEESVPNRRQELFVKPDAVFWGCNVAAGNADWLIDTTEISETVLRRIKNELDQPEAAFK